MAALFWFGLRDVGILQLFYSRAVVQSTIVDFPIFWRTPQPVEVLKRHVFRSDGDVLVSRSPVHFSHRAEFSSSVQHFQPFSCGRHKRGKIVRIDAVIDATSPGGRKRSQFVPTQTVIRTSRRLDSFSYEAAQNFVVDPNIQN